MTPGEAEQAREELGRAEETLRDAEVLLDSGSREGAASRLYYAAFHAARAALTVRGLYAKTHSGRIALFERTFGAAPLLGNLLELRAQADYAMEPFVATQSACELSPGKSLSSSHDAEQSSKKPSREAPTNPTRHRMTETPAMEAQRRDVSRRARLPSCFFCQRLMLPFLAPDTHGG